MNKVVLPVAVEVTSVPRAGLHPVSGPWPEWGDAKASAGLGEPDLRVIRTAQVSKISLAIIVKIARLPRAQLNAVARPRFHQRDSEASVLH
jgi:hypothetical protein